MTFSNPAISTQLVAVQNKLISFLYRHLELV